MKMKKTATVSNTNNRPMTERERKKETNKQISTNLEYTTHFIIQEQKSELTLYSESNCLKL